MKTKPFCSVASTFLTVSLFISCLSNTNSQRKFDIKDTTSLIQKVLSDRQLETELLRDFGNQPLKLVAGYAVKPTQQFWFAGKPVKVISLTGDVYQIHEQHAKEFYVSVPEVRFFSTDSATVSLIFHAGNATSFFNLKNAGGEWIIKERQDGKF